jgi:hypothetical protein
LLAGPKTEESGTNGTRYHAKERMAAGGISEWAFEERTASMMPTQMILTRVLVAKVENMERLAQLLRQIPIRQGQEGWNCVSWVQEALSELGKSKKIVGTSAVEWNAVRDAAMDYVQRKKAQHRFDGEGSFDTSHVPTFDLIQKKETIV